MNMAVLSTSGIALDTLREMKEAVSQARPTSVVRR